MHMLQHLHLGGHVIELFGHLGADLDERAATGVLPLPLGQLVQDRDTWQVGGNGLASGLERRARLILAQWGGFEFDLGAYRRGDLQGGLRLVEQPALTRGDAELLATGPVMMAFSTRKASSRNRIRCSRCPTSALSRSFSLSSSAMRVATSTVLSRKLAGASNMRALSHDQALDAR
jgi:hypothetical protein